MDDSLFIREYLNKYKQALFETDVSEELIEMRNLLRTIREERKKMILAGNGQGPVQGDESRLRKKGLHVDAALMQHAQQSPDQKLRLRTRLHGAQCNPRQRRHLAASLGW